MVVTVCGRPVGDVDVAAHIEVGPGAQVVGLHKLAGAYLATAPPGGPKVAPRWSQGGPKMAPRPPKMAPRWPHDPPRCPNTSHYGAGLPRRLHGLMYADIGHPYIDMHSYV